MPRIDDAINQGPLSGSEREVMRVIGKKPTHIWSTSAEDLAELAIWVVDRSITNPEGLFPATPMDQSTVIEFDSYLGQVDSSVKVRTYQLSTIRWALSRLAKKELIAAFILHNRRYYGSHEAFSTVCTAISAMDQAALDRSGFSPMTTAELDTGDELSGDTAFDPIGKP